MMNTNLRSAIGFVIGLAVQSAFAQDAKPASKPEPNRPAPAVTPAKPADATPTPTKPADKPAAPAKPTGDQPPQTPPPATDASGLPTQATIEMIMNEAVKSIARRYNLNEAQTQKTDEIMKRDVNKFLKEHEADVWPVIRDLIASGFGAKPPQNPEEVKRIGKAAEPLLKLAKDAVYDGNREWRKCLNEEQKATHDYDLAEMDKAFTKIEQNFRSWTDGRPVDGGIFPPPEPDHSPPTPRQPPPGLPEPEIEIFIRATIFDTFVEEFIKEYVLDPAQIDAARSILAEYKSKANDFKEANRDRLSKIAREYKEAMDSHDRERIAKAEADRKKLLEPVYELFGQMDERLKALLTTAQVERRGAKQAAASAEKTPNPQDKKPPATNEGTAKPDVPVKPVGDKPADPKPADAKPANPKPAPAPEAKPSSNDKP